MTNGKGSDRRPAQVSEKQIAENWARTFSGGVRHTAGEAKRSRPITKADK